MVRKGKNKLFWSCYLDGGCKSGWVIESKIEHPFKGILFRETEADDIVDWLNSKYQRFSFKVTVSQNGIPVYMIWDNLKKDSVNFRPYIDNSNFTREALEEYVDFLNELWYGDANEL